MHCSELTALVQGCITHVLVSVIQLECRRRVCQWINHSIISSSSNDSSSCHLLTGDGCSKKEWPTRSQRLANRFINIILQPACWQLSKQGCSQSYPHIIIIIMTLVLELSLSSKQGYEYFGITRKDGKTIYREWAPGAKAAALIGDFNGWEPYWMDKDQWGVWSIELPDSKS